MQAQLHYTPDPDDTALLIVDPQKAFGDIVPVPDVAAALAKMRLAATAWRRVGGQVFVTRHEFASKDRIGRIGDFLPHIYDAVGAGAPGADFHPDLVEDTDVVVTKDRFNALIGTDLAAQLHDRGVRTVVTCGLTTPICVGATVDGLMMSDFQTVALSDAAASQPIGSMAAAAAHDAAIVRMGYIFAEIISTQRFLDELSTVRENASAS